MLYFVLVVRFGALPSGAGGVGDVWGNWRDGQGLEALVAHACCLLLGVGMVYYLARTEEMVLREHFKCQYLGAHLFQAVRYDPFSRLSLCPCLSSPGIGMSMTDPVLYTPTKPTQQSLLEQALCDRLLAAMLPATIAQLVLDRPCNPLDVSQSSTVGGGPASFSGSRRGGLLMNGAGTSSGLLPSHAPPALSGGTASLPPLHPSSLSASRAGGEAAAATRAPPMTAGGAGAGAAGATIAHAHAISTPGASAASSEEMMQDQAGRAGGGTSDSASQWTPGALLDSSLASAAPLLLQPPWADPARRRAAWLAAAVQGREDGGGRHGRGQHRQGWIYPSGPLLHKALLRRHHGRVPPATHPLKQAAASRFVQRKFCTVLIAKAVRGSHLGVAPVRLAAALAEFDTAAVHHRVSRISNTGSTYVASCGLFETWGSARRDALAAVAMASDLVAIAEALGLELCVGLTSGSVVGTLDPVSHAFYDLVGDVVSAATLMAELARAGQVFLGDSTYQLLAKRESSLHFRLPRVGTHAVRVRLLGGGEETVRALSNPYAASWWHEQRQAEVLQAVCQWEEEQRALPRPLPGEAEEAAWRVEEGRVGEGIELTQKRQRQRQQTEDRAQQHRLFFSLANVYDLRGRLERKGGGAHAADRYPTALATVDEGLAAFAPLCASPPPGRGRCAGVARAVCTLRGGALLADLTLPPRLELELLAAGLTAAVLVWSVRLHPWVLAGLLALIAAQAFLRWRPLRRGPRPVVASPSAMIGAALLLLYYLLCAVVLLALPLDTASYPLTLLRVMFVLVPALHLPTPPAVALAAEVYVVVLVSHVVHAALTGESSAKEIRVRLSSRSGMCKANVGDSW